MKKTVVTYILLAFGIAPLNAQSLELTLIANDGVLISSGETQVLIDGLYRDHYPDFPPPPEGIQTSLETAQSPFDQVDALLVTHRHEDHFHPEATGRHLVNNANATLIAPEQAASEIQQSFEDYATIQNRIRGRTPELGKVLGEEVGDLKIDVLSLPHANPARFSSIENVGYLFKLGEVSFLHIGDANITAEILAPYKLAEASIDYALVPYWTILDPASLAILKEQIAPRHFVAIHIPPKNAERVTTHFASTYPDVLVLTEPMQTIEIAPEK